MEIELKHKLTNAVLFTCDVSLELNLSTNQQKGLAIKAAITAHADLHGADLSGANLRRANLHGADLSGADLHGADLSGANLRRANLHGADLSGADLYGADLREADLREADLYGADLHGADLRRANLHGADLSGADLREADLREADLLVITTEIWIVYIQKDYTRIGCQYNKNIDWFNYTDAQIQAMDSRALLWWNKYKVLIQAGIETLNKEVV